jgi:hypothetical protein
MGKLIERCAGIDIGKRFLLCCVMTGAAHEEPRSETRRFDTTVPVLERLRSWLHEERVTDVVMRARDRTGFQFSIYWRAMSGWCWPILKR